jgi:hypothetical protein
MYQENYKNHIKTLVLTIMYFSCCRRQHTILNMKYCVYVCPVSLAELCIAERQPIQSRSQSMPVRGLGCGMTLGKSNRNRYLIGCRDHQCCRHINACFLRELRGNIREVRIINVYQIWNAKSNNINRRM